MAVALKAKREDRSHRFWQEVSHPQAIVGGDAASEVGVWPQQSRQAGFRGRARALALVQCSVLCGAGGGGLHRLVRGTALDPPELCDEGIPYPRRDAGGPSAGGTLALPGRRRSRAADAGSRSRASLGLSAWEEASSGQVWNSPAQAPTCPASRDPWVARLSPAGSGRLTADRSNLVPVPCPPGLRATGPSTSPVTACAPDTLVPPPCREEPPECCAESCPS